MTLTTPPVRIVRIDLSFSSYPNRPHYAIEVADAVEVLLVLGGMLSSVNVDNNNNCTLEFSVLCGSERSAIDQLIETWRPVVIPPTTPTGAPKPAHVQFADEIDRQVLDSLFKPAPTPTPPQRSEGDRMMDFFLGRNSDR